MQRATKPDPTEPTWAQSLVLTLIAALGRERPPTITELADAYGCSKKGMWDHLGALERKRLIRWQHGTTRGIWLTDAGRQAARDWLDCDGVAVTADGPQVYENVRA